MAEDETLIIQSGKPIGLIKTHDDAPLVIMANCNIVGQWAKAENFYELREERPDLLGRAHRRRLAIHRQPGRHPGHLRNLHAHRRAALRRRPCRPLRPDRRARRHGRLAAARRPHGRRGDPLRRGRRRARRQAQGDRLPRCNRARDLDDGAGDGRSGAKRERGALSVAVHRQRGGHLSRDLLARGVIPDVVTDQTSAHDLVYGYVPQGFSLDEVRRAAARRSGTADGGEPRLDRRSRARDARLPARAARTCSTTAI